MTPRIFQIITLQLKLCTLNIGKNLKAVRGSYLPFVIKHALFPLGTTNLLASCSGLWGVRVETFIKDANFFTTSSWWHDITSTKVSCVSHHFSIFWIKMPCHSMHMYAFVSMSWDQYVWKFLLIYCTWNQLTHKYTNMIFQTIMVSCCMYMWFKFELRSLNG